MKYNIVISNDAVDALDRHAEYLSRVCKATAFELVDTILADIESLGALPDRCPWYENRFIQSNRHRKLLSSKRYLIIFEIDQDTVFVDYIIDCRQNNNEWMK